MTDASPSRTDLDIAHAFERAYREGDREGLRAVLAPDARVRVLMPKGLMELAGADGLADVLQPFFAKWSVVSADAQQLEVLRQNAMRTGRLTRTVQRLVLRGPEGAGATMVVSHLLGIVGDRVAIVDELCTGIMPDAP
jgi:hypothetical protein